MRNVTRRRLRHHNLLGTIGILGIASILSTIGTRDTIGRDRHLKHRAHFRHQGGFRHHRQHHVGTLGSIAPQSPEHLRHHK